VSIACRQKNDGVSESATLCKSEERQKKKKEKRKSTQIIIIKSAVILSEIFFALTFH
jgi:hypothetical protein